MKKKKSARRKGTKGSLLVIALLLIGSAFLRLGDGAGQAFALDPDQTETARSAVVAQAEQIHSSEKLEAMLKAFQEREKKIEAREKSIVDRMHALRIADDEVTSKLKELKQAEQMLRETIALADSAAENDLDRLTKVYETMKPKQAAALFEQMDPNFAAGFLGRMRPEAAALIMAGLSPEAANLYSVVLAGRNANVPKE